MRDFRIYMAVAAYVAGKNFAEIDDIKREIIELYKDDFRKIDSSGLISKMFEFIPSQLALKKKRFMISGATGKRKSAKDMERLSDLIDSRTVLICHDVSDPSVSLSQTKRLDAFKFYLADTGLFATLLFNDESHANQDIYRKLLSDRLHENLSYLYKNAAAQVIASSGQKLYYHTWPVPDSTHSYEIDFLILNQCKLIPIEIKSSKVPHKSIDIFGEKYSKCIYRKWIISQQDIHHENDILFWPLYCLPVLAMGFS